MEQRQRRQENSDDLNIVSLPQQNMNLHHDLEIVQMAHSLEICEDQEVYGTEDGRSEEAFDIALVPSSSTDHQWDGDAKCKGDIEVNWKPIACRRVKISRIGCIQFWYINVDLLSSTDKPPIELSNHGTKLYDLDLLDDRHIFYIEVREIGRLHRYFVRWPEPGDSKLFLEKEQADPNTFLGSINGRRRFVFKRSSETRNFTLKSADGRNLFVAVDSQQSLLVAKKEREEADKWHLD